MRLPRTVLPDARRPTRAAGVWVIGLMMTLLLAMPLQTRACGVCGGLMLGLMPNERLNRVGFAYRYVGFGGYRNVPGQANQPHPFARITHDPAAHGVAEPVYSSRDREYFQTVDVRLQWFLGSRWSVLAIMPFHHNQFRINGQTRSLQSVGDAISVLQFYPVWQNGVAFSHRLSLGVGVKAPTGRFARENVASDARLYGGTGSVDALGSVIYMLRGRRWGAMAEANGRLNSRNPQGWWARPAGNVQVQVFRDQPLGTKGRANLMPHAGVFAEGASGDFLNHVWVLGTGGRWVLATLGADVYVGRFSLQLTAMLPLWQEVFGIQQGNGGRAQAAIAYAFSAKKTATNTE